MTRQCEDCGADAPIIGRFAGFFGVQPRYSRYCIDCIGNHAAEHPENPSPQTLREQLAAAMADEKARYGAKKRKRTSVRSSK